MNKNSLVIALALSFILVSDFCFSQGNRFATKFYEYTPSGYNNVPIPNRRYKKMTDKAVSLVVDKKYDEAFKVLNSAIKQFPTKHEAYMFRGMAYNNLQNYQAAISDFNTVITLEPSIAPYVYAIRAKAKAEIRAYQGAISDYKKTLEYAPDVDELYFSIGELYQKQKKLNEACKWWLSGSKLGNKDCDKQYKSFCGNNNQVTAPPNTYSIQSDRNTSTTPQRNASLKEEIGYNNYSKIQSLKNEGFTLINEFERGIYNDKTWSNFESRFSDVVDDLDDIVDLIKPYSMKEADDVRNLYHNLDAVYSFIGESSPYDSRNFDLTFDKMNRTRSLLSVYLGDYRNDLCMPIVKVSWNDQTDIYLIRNESNALKTFEFSSDRGSMSGGVGEQSYRYIYSIVQTNQYDSKPSLNVNKFICKEGMTGRILGNFSNSSKQYNKPITTQRNTTVIENYPKYIVVESTSFRQSATSKSGVIKRFRSGDTVEVIDCSDTWWCQIKHEGNVGWVKKKLIEPRK